MKQSRSAITFLMAQYRAIFKHAFLKGLVSAAVLTASVAAVSPANAAALGNVSDLKGLFDETTLASGSGVFEDLSASTDLSGGGKYTWNASLDLQANTSSGSGALTITSSGSNLKISGDGSLTLSAGADGKGSNSGSFTLATSDSNKAELYISSINIKNGAMTLSGSSGSVIAGSKNLTVDNGTVDLLSTDGDVELTADQIKITGGQITVQGGGSAGSGSATFGSESSKLTLNGGEIILSDDSDADGSKLQGNILANTSDKITGIKFSGSGTISAYTTNTNGAKIHIVAGDASGSGTGIIDLSANQAGNQQLKIANDGTLEAASGSITIQGTANPNGHTTVTLAENADLIIASGGSAATNILVSGNSTLELYSSHIIDGDIAGALIISGGTVALQDKNEVTLNDIAFAATKTDGKIAASGTGSLKADKLVLDGSKTAIGANVADGFAFKANTLTIKSGSGSGGLTASGTFVVNNQLVFSGSGLTSQVKLELGNSGALAINDSEAFKQLGTTYDNDKDALKQQQIEMLLSQTGTIEGDNTTISGSSGTISIVNGTWTASSNITLSGDGSLHVGKVSGANGLESVKFTAAELVLGTGNTLNLNDGTLRVGDSGSKTSGVAELLSAKLDLTSSTLEQNGSTISIEKAGELYLTSSQVKEILVDDTSKAAIDVKADGSLFVANNLELGIGNFDSSSAASKIAVSGTGRLVVDGTLSLSKEATPPTGGTPAELNFGDGNIIAEELELNDKFVKLSDGTITLNSGIYSNENATTLTVANTLNLGDLDKLEGVATLPGNSVDVDLKLDAGKVNFQAGNWNALTITTVNKPSAAEDYSITVGQSGSDVVLDANGEALTASLTGIKLDAGDTHSLLVNEYGSARFTELTAVTDSIDLNGGSLTIDGKITEDKSDPENVVISSYGVKLAADSITVGNNAHLTFGANATSAISVNAADEDHTTSYVEVSGGAFASGSLDLQAGGLVSFTFADGTTFDKDSLADLRKDLFTSDSMTNGVLNGRIDLGGASIDGITVGEDNKIGWSELEDYADTLVDIQNNELKNAVVTDISSTDQIRGNFGALQGDDTITSNQYIQLSDRTTLQNAAANGGKFVSNAKGELINVDVAKSLGLVGDGEIGNVRVAKDGIVQASSGSVVFAEVNGKSGSAVEAYNSNITVKGDAQAGKFTTDETSSFVVEGDLITVAAGTFSEEAKSRFAGTVTVKGDANLNNDTEFESAADFAGTLTANSWIGLYGETTAKAAVFNANAEIGDGATLKAETVTLGATGNTSSTLRVGEDQYYENGTWNSGSTGYLEADVLVGNGGRLVVDPEYTQATSVAAVGKFGDTVPAGKSFSANGGYANVDLILGQNSALMAGKDASVAAMKEFISQYQVDGHLTEDGVGAVMALNSKIVMADGKRIIIDPSRSALEILGYTDQDGKYHNGSLDQSNSPYSAVYEDGTGSTTKIAADLYLGSGSILALNDAIVAEGTAIEFAKGDAAILGEEGAKIVLVGDAFLDSRNIQLFKDQGTTSTASGRAVDGDTVTDNTGVKILGTAGKNDIVVETLNGLMYFVLKAGTETQGGTLNFDVSKAKSTFTQASSPVRETLLAYASRTANYNEYYSDTTNTVERVDFINDVADKNLVNYTYDETNNSYTITLTDAGKKAGLTVDDFVGVDGVLYNRGYNTYLERITRDSLSGVEGDQVARLSAFGGAAQAAFVAGTTTYDAISGRMGVGAQSGAITFADNGQGSGLWVTPIYKSNESSDFNAQGVNYGVDMSLYGIALGGDYTLANGVRVGAMFNVGSGDADGQGTAAGVSNDFDYYGFGIYAGYAMDKMSVVADLSYTLVDNTLEVSNFADKLSASTDTSSMSIGVTGQYALDFSGMSVVPHAGLRYTNIDMDDYVVKGAQYGDIARYGADSLSVFSIPVGVTFAKEITAGSWTIKPALDVTLTANMGDDLVEGNVAWNGISNLGTKVESEFLDSFTYGATFGIGAKSGNMSLGIGVNYTGSSNTDEYGINANARFVF